MAQAVTIRQSTVLSFQLVAVPARLMGMMRAR
jgi:hypothetical protein